MPDGVGKSVRTNDSLLVGIGILHSCLTICAGTEDFLVINVGVHVHDVLEHFDYHDQFFQQAVGRMFVDTIQCAFYPACARLYTAAMELPTAIG